MPLLHCQLQPLDHEIVVYFGEDGAGAPRTQAGLKACLSVPARIIQRGQIDNSAEEGRDTSYVLLDEFLHHLSQGGIHRCGARTRARCLAPRAKLRVDQVALQPVIQTGSSEPGARHSPSENAELWAINQGVSSLLYEVPQPFPENASK